MKKPKFKVGDVLVVTGFPVSDSISDSYWNLGDYFTVYRIKDNGVDHFYGPDDNRVILFEQEVELYEIAFSPLWEALK